MKVIRWLLGSWEHQFWVLLNQNTDTHRVVLGSHCCLGQVGGVCGAHLCCLGSTTQLHLQAPRRHQLPEQPSSLTSYFSFKSQRDGSACRELRPRACTLAARVLKNVGVRMRVSPPAESSRVSCFLTNSLSDFRRGT